MRNYTEQEMYRVLGKEMQVSETVEERLAQTYQQIRAQKQKKTRRRGLWYGAAGTAAAMLVAGICCASNPALAAQLPLIGHLFEKIGSDASYPGDYSEVGMPLVTEEEADGNAAGTNAAAQADAAEMASGAEKQAAPDEGSVKTASAQAGSAGLEEGRTEAGAEELTVSKAAENESSADAYTQTADCMTVTLSEVYCNEVALYVTMQLKTEEPMTDYFELCDNGSPILKLNGQAKFDYCGTPEPLDVGELSGKLIDDCTYLGMYRLELAETLADYSEFYKTVEEQGIEINSQTIQEYGDLIQKNELPEQFDVSISIAQIIGDRKDPASIYEAAGVEMPSSEKLEEMPDEEFNALQQELSRKVPDYDDYPSKYLNYWYDGPFTFDLSVSVDHDRTVTVPVDEDTGDGFAVSSVTRTPFELLVESNATSFGTDAVLQVLDADGRRMETGRLGGTENMLAIDDHDVSRIDIYWVAWDDFEGEKIKGSYFDEHETNEDGQTLKEVLDGCSLYHREVVLGE